MTFEELFECERLIAAHRGYRAVRPENTLSAFEASIGQCDFVELDVGFSSDGTAVLIHDDTLSRTTDAEAVEGFAPPYAVVDYPRETLQKLDASSWFLRSDPFGMVAESAHLREELMRLPVQHIPTLSEALVLLGRHDVPINIEIKDMRGTRFDETAVATIAALVQSFCMEEKVLLSSFNHQYLREAKRIAPQIMRAALQEGAHPKALIAYLKDLDVACYHCDLEITTPEIVRAVIDAGMIANVYTVNTPEEKERVFAWGVKSVFTDFL